MTSGTRHPETILPDRTSTSTMHITMVASIGKIGWKMKVVIVKVIVQYCHGNYGSGITNRCFVCYFIGTSTSSSTGTEALVVPYRVL